MTQTILTIDIGGTAIKTALYNKRGENLVDYPEEPTQVTPTGNSITNQIAAIAQRVQGAQTIDGVAISSAAIIHPYEGRVEAAGPNIPAYIGTELKKTIETATGLPCTVENDVNCAALGESWLGAAKDSNSVFCITVGTGIGGAFLMNGKLWHGYNYAAGEIGFIPTHPDNASFESIASTSALLRDYQRLTGRAIDGRQLFALAQQGDKDANSAIDDMMEKLAFGLCAPIYLLAPETLIIGGGIAQQKQLFEPKIRAVLTSRILNPYFLPKRIVCAALGNRAGMIGALKHFLQCQEAGRI